MPNQAHSAIVGDPWHRCQRCGCDVRTSDLVRQNGLLVCRVYDCADNRLVERRPRMILERLKDSTELKPVPILTETYVDDTIDQI